VINKPKAFIHVKEGLEKSTLKEVIALLLKDYLVYATQSVPDTIKVGSISEIEDLKLAISLGGDGTLLSLARKVGSIPILGINLGGRGAITEVETEELPLILQMLKEGRFWLERRLRIKGKINGVETVNALNEIYISRANFNVTPTFTISAELGFSYSQRMDGLIISTPTGSTGYNYSAGGPVLKEDLEEIVITPVLPIKYIPSIVLPICKVEVFVSDHSYAIIDGQNRYELKPREIIEITKGQPINLVRFRHRPLKQFFKVTGL